MAGEERFLVTGAAGCLGAWTVARLAAEGTSVVAFDASLDKYRLRYLMGEGAVEKVPWVQGDIRDLAQLESLAGSHSITHLVHLAALQVPACKADPVTGSQVNVVGTMNVFEVARRSEGRIRGLAYASSAAAFGPAANYADGIATDTDLLAPQTLYGVFKQANETTARIYGSDWGTGSIGLRPCVVYGPGRDQGLTSDPTKVMLAAARGESGHIAFGGSSTFHHAEDVAAMFIAAARLEPAGAAVYNVGGTDTSIEEFASMVEKAVPKVAVTFGTEALPLPSAIEGSPGKKVLGDVVRFRTLEEGVDDTIEQFRRLLREGLISTRE
ncbi:MAG TPA: NAD(P)-dependent oxidoreductase [Acidimicrobiia bacterium]|nr:NAD(P)-dependent oxidoreductase [Acidimicrobiia bacterium]